MSALLSRRLRIYQIYGASTDVGKTIFSTLLAHSHRKVLPYDALHYLKPISTGPVADADDAHLYRFVPKPILTTAKILFQYDQPKSPHLVTENPPPDKVVLQGVKSHIESCAAEFGNGTLLLETAGGVHSPSLSGSSQADLYRPLRLPVVLVADSKLGGISTTISSYEALRLRGYDVEGVMMFRDQYYQNDSYLVPYFDKLGVHTCVVDPPPERNWDEEKDQKALGQYYQQVGREDTQMRGMVSELKSRHEKRIKKLEMMAPTAKELIWYPFTQQKDMKAKEITTIDSAYGDYFQTFSSKDNKEGAVRLDPMFDGSASWWTQGMGHGNPKLSLAAAYAAGRYGHVMFAGGAHEPAIDLAKLLIDNVHNERLTRVFYSDNGSTGCEVAIKMAIKATRERYGWEKGTDTLILGLKGAYHGDTIGAMDCAEPGAFNKEVDWYKGRGYWLHFPTVGMKDGVWRISIPRGMNPGAYKSTKVPDLTALFNLEARQQGKISGAYRAYIQSSLQHLQTTNQRVGALMIEPIVLGAGGMQFVDPLFQQILIDVVRNNPVLFDCHHPTAKKIKDPKRWTGLPVIYDEVFTGLYRLGRFSSGSLLQREADISVHAKLLTGGLIPLSATLASEEIFNTFLGESKGDALLHGHSYTAHAVGCQVAKESVQMLMDMDAGSAWSKAKRDWTPPVSSVPEDSEDTGPKPSVDPVFSVWSLEFVDKVSRLPQVEKTWALGSVFTAHLNPGTKSKGYNSNISEGFLTKIRELNEDGGVHARALGDTVYIMTSQTTRPEVVRKLEERILEAL
jgi:dethiobiotin synthetase/adenosylmethionine--8-amino-7-oxononanoate aminotransferase